MTYPSMKRELREEIIKVEKCEDEDCIASKGVYIDPKKYNVELNFKKGT